MTDDSLTSRVASLGADAWDVGYAAGHADNVTGKRTANPFRPLPDPEPS